MTPEEKRVLNTILPGRKRLKRRVNQDSLSAVAYTSLKSIGSEEFAVVVTFRSGYAILIWKGFDLEAIQKEIDTIIELMPRLNIITHRRGGATYDIPTEEIPGARF